jgi:hypothetical protein
MMESLYIKNLENKSVKQGASLEDPVIGAKIDKISKENKNIEVLFEENSFAPKDGSVFNRKDYNKD